MCLDMCTCVKSIVVDRVYFTETEFEAHESDGALEVVLNLERSMDMSNEVTVTVVTRSLAGPDAAEGIVCMYIPICWYCLLENAEYC